jgi:hypothetical protein
MTSADVCIFMNPRRAAYNRIAGATCNLPPLPTHGTCANAHVHALGVCASKLALANWLDALPFPLLEKAIIDLEHAKAVHADNEPRRALLDSEVFMCFECRREYPAAYMDSHIANHTCQLDLSALSRPYMSEYEPLLI